MHDLIQKTRYRETLIASGPKDVCESIRTTCQNSKKAEFGELVIRPAMTFGEYVNWHNEQLQK